MEALCFLLGKVVVATTQVLGTKGFKGALTVPSKWDTLSAGSKGMVWVHLEVAGRRFNVTDCIESIAHLVPVPVGIGVFTLQPANEIPKVHVKTNQGDC